MVPERPTRLGRSGYDVVEVEGTARGERGESLSGMDREVVVGGCSSSGVEVEERARGDNLGCWTATVVMSSKKRTAGEGERKVRARRCG